MMDYKAKKFDLDWGDEGVVPEIVFPDTMFIFKRMGEVILEMADPVSGERVLDVGCGRAIDALQFAKNGALAIGLDPSSKMMLGAKSFLNDNNGDNVDLVRAIGEAMPFKNRSLDKIICKGALDHFADMPKTMSDMAQTLKPTGSAIIAIANFDSLSCKIGRNWFPIVKKLYRQKGDRHPWQPPEDHNYKFDCPILKETVANDFKIQKIKGMSLLWTAPYWGKILSLMPKWTSNGILKTLDGIASRLPSLADVIIIKVAPKV
jgi:SAM-dependent methyltransferase